MLPKGRKPTHPGKILSEDFLKVMQISPRQFAEKLGNPWTEAKIQEIIEGKESISNKAAQEFATALDTTTDFWLHLQKIYHEWEHLHKQLYIIKKAS